MEQIINFQEELYSRIIKSKTNFKKSPKERITEEYVEGRLELLEGLWAEFSSGHKKLMMSSSKGLQDIPYVKDDMFDKCQEVFLEYKSELKSVLTKLNKISVQPLRDINYSNNSTSNNVKLPKIVIPTFSGKYSEWNTFRDLYTALIHKNHNLSDVQKLLYLKAIRAICGVGPYESCRPLFPKLQLLTLPCLYIYEVCIFVKRNMSLFKKAGDINRNHSIRYPNRLIHEHIPRTTLYLKNCHAMCIKIYNKIPEDLKLERLDTFKTKLYVWLVTNNFYSLNDFLLM